MCQSSTLFIFKRLAPFDLVNLLRPCKRCAHLGACTARIAVDLHHNMPTGQHLITTIKREVPMQCHPRFGLLYGSGLFLLLFVGLSTTHAATRHLHAGDSLLAAISSAAPGDTLLLGPGRYTSSPTDGIDTLCGNCLDHKTRVTFSTGFRIDEPLHLIGTDCDSTILVTRAGYGVFFDNAGQGSMANLTVTGGVRDEDGAATDAGVVARGTELTLHHCAITSNDDRADSLVIGIAGIVGREGAELSVENCLIRGNSWDGIALYRGARALIRDNTIAEGRGVGIGITWDAVAEVYRNDVSGYWKGIGSFGTSRVVLRDNVVHDVLGWGIIATASSNLDCVNNVIARAGNCGFAVWSEESRGRFINNVVLAPGWRKEWVCPRVGVWQNGPDVQFEAHHNVIWDPEEEPWRKSVWREGNEEPENTALAADTTLSGRFVVMNPRFVNALENDYQPAPDSPLIDAGSPDESDVDGTRSNIGLSADALRRIKK